MQSKDRRLVTERSLEDHTDAALVPIRQTANSANTTSSQAVSLADAANQKSDNAITRVEQVETMAGLAPGEVTDAQTANLLQQPGSSTRNAFGQELAAEITTDGTATRNLLTGEFANRAAALAPRSPAPKPPRGQLISRFQPRDAWSDAAGGWEFHTDRVINGTRSWGFNSGSGTNERQVTRLELPAPVDIRGKALILRVFISNVSNLSTFVPSFDSTTTAPPGLADNTWQYQGGTMRQVDEGHWIDLLFDYGTGRIQTGSPDQQNMLRLAINTRTSGPTEFRVNSATLVDANDLIPSHPEGVIILESDDGHGSNELMHEVMSGYGVPGTINMIAENADRPERLSIEQLRRWQDMDGWDIQGHAYALTTQNFLNLTPEELDEDLSKLKTWLRAHGFDGEFVAYPQGGFNLTVQEITARYFRGGRTVYPRQRTAPGVRPYAISAMSVTNTDTPANVIAYMDSLVNSGVPCHVVFHHWMEGPEHTSSTNGWGTDQLREIIEHGLAQGYRFATYSEIYT